MAKVCLPRHRVGKECGTFFSTFLPRSLQAEPSSDFGVPSLDPYRVLGRSALSKSHMGGWPFGESGEACLSRMFDSSADNESFGDGFYISGLWMERSVAMGKESCVYYIFDSSHLGKTRSYARPARPMHAWISLIVWACKQPGSRGCFRAVLHSFFRVPPFVIVL